MDGVLTVSKSADLAVLKADVKPQKLLRFLDLTKTGELSTGAKVAVVGSSLAGNEGALAKQPSLRIRPSDWKLRGQLPQSSVGSPVVNENGDVVGIVTSAGEKPLLVLSLRWTRSCLELRPILRHAGRKCPERVRHRTRRQSRDCSLRLRRHFRQANLCLGSGAPAVSD